MTSQTVLIISEASQFAAEVTAHWTLPRVRPEFAALGPQSFLSSQVPCDLVLAGPMRAQLLAAVLQHATRDGHPVVCVLGEPVPPGLRRKHSSVIFLARQEGSLDIALQVSAEVLRRTAAVARARRAEQQVTAQQHDAALGRYMLEARHNMNNALTSVLGNAELLLLETARLPQPMREQVDILHSMTLRMHEIMQRFSSLDVEMRFAAKDSPLPASASSPAVASAAVAV